MSGRPKADKGAGLPAVTDNILGQYEPSVDPQDVMEDLVTQLASAHLELARLRSALTHAVTFARRLQAQLTKESAP